VIQHDHSPEFRERLTEAALRPLRHNAPGFWVLVTVLALMVAGAFAAWMVQLDAGLGTAGYSDSAFWGIYEANLVAFIGVSYGGALVSAILRLTRARWRAPITRLAEAMALFSLLAGMAFAVIHLGRPERLWLLVTRPNISSPLVWDFAAVMTYLVATLIFLYLPLIPDIALLRDQFRSKGGWRYRLYSALAVQWEDLPEQRRLLHSGTLAMAILIIPIAVLVHSVLSWAFAVTGRPGWDSTIFAPYFVVAALFSGIATVILVVGFFRHGYHLQEHISVKHFRYLGYLLLVLDLLYLYFTFTELLTEGYVGNDAVVPVLQATLLGQYAPFFWFFVLAGGIVPLLLIAIPKTRTIPGIVSAAALVVTAMWLKRLIIVVPTVAHPLIAGSWGSFKPTLVSGAITLGAAASIPLFLMLFFKLFPILAIYEMEEIAEESSSEQPAAVYRPSRTMHAIEGGSAS
jgi:Ni/Fe-hydrogenase subunit HybB-like protein